MVGMKALHTLTTFASLNYQVIFRCHLLSPFPVNALLNKNLLSYGVAETVIRDIWSQGGGPRG